MNIETTAATTRPAIDDLATQVDVASTDSPPAPLDGVATEVSHGPPAAIERFASSATQTIVGPLQAIDTEEIEESDGSDEGGASESEQSEQSAQSEQSGQRPKDAPRKSP